MNRSSPAYIRWVQSSLNQIMGLNLAVDGINGVQTRSAVRSFQQSRGLAADGVVGPITEAAMVASGAPPPPGSSVPGGGPGTRPPTGVNRSHPLFIAWVQASLNRVQGSGLVVDGINGPKTKAAVKAFQRSRGLVADGIVGPVTEAALIAALAGTTPVGGCPPHKARIRLHMKVLKSPTVAIAIMVDSMKQVYGPAGFLVELATTETINEPDLADDLDLGGGCPAGTFSSEHTRLFSHRNSVGSDDIAVYFVGAMSNPSGLVGCAAHPVGKPAVVVAEDASQWVLAHEIGHVLNLAHTDDGKTRTSDELMFPVDAFTNPPPDLSSSDVSKVDTSNLTINC